MRSGLLPHLTAGLVERAQQGDPRAWEALVRRHERLVFAVARAWRLSDDDMADVFQEVFAALVRSLPRLRESRALVRWISTTTDRIARTTALRRRREQALQGQDETALERQPALDEPVGADLERLERQAAVRLAMAAISDRCRRLLSALLACPAAGAESLAREPHLDREGPRMRRALLRRRDVLGKLLRDRLQQLLNFALRVEG